MPSGICGLVSTHLYARHNPVQAVHLGLCSSGVLLCILPLCNAAASKMVQTRTTS